MRKIDWVISHGPSWEIAKKHFNAQAIQNDARVNVIEETPLDYLRSNGHLYDVAFSDHGLHGSHKLEHTHDYYQALSHHLRATGIALVTSGLWLADHQAILTQKKMVAEHFPQVGIAGLSLPGKLGGLQTWIWVANKDMSVVDAPLLKAKLDISPIDCQYYSIQKHQAFFNPMIEQPEF